MKCPPVCHTCGDVLSPYYDAFIARKKKAVAAELKRRGINPSMENINKMSSAVNISMSDFFTDYQLGHCCKARIITSVTFTEYRLQTYLTTAPKEF